MAELGGGKFQNGAITGAFAYVAGRAVQQLSDPYDPVFGMRQSEVQGIIDSSPQVVWQLGDPLPQGGVDFIAGFGDVLSLGGTILVREGFGWNDAVDFGSGAYLGGAATGTAVHFIGFRTGGELSFGRNFRVAPWGNRTGHPTGRYPHYHRRIVDPKSGQTVPGGSIKRHRPWDRRTTDRSVLGRF